MSDQVQHKKERVRSPSYPSIDLQTAIERVQTIYQHEKRSAAPVAVVAKHCGVDGKSSAGQRLIAALKQFGLVVDIGSGDDRKVKLSDRALDILLAADKNSAEYMSAIKTAALSPKIHQTLWEHYERELPSDATLRSHLIRNLDFNDAMVDGFIKEFRSTVGFAQLTQDDRIISSDAEEVADVKPVRGLDRPKGTRATQLAETDRLPKRPTMLATKESAVREDVFTMDYGNVVIQWPERMTKEDIQDLSDWMEIVIRKIKRSSNDNSPDDDPPDND